jgi:hypothetical protein
MRAIIAFLCWRHGSGYKQGNGRMDCAEKKTGRRPVKTILRVGISQRVVTLSFAHVWFPRHISTGELQ